MTELNYTSADYAFLSSMLRAREAKMLTPEKAYRMIDAPTLNDAVSMLEENGYTGLKDLDSSEIFRKLRDCRIDIYNGLSAMEPAKLPLDFFRVKFDYHNVKAVVKSEALGLSPDALMYNCGRITKEKFKEALEQQDLSGFPQEMRKALDESRAILARTGDPQLSDICADKAMFSERLSIAMQMNDPFVINYMRMYIDFVNLRTIVRAQRMKRNTEFVKTALISGGNVSADSLQATSLSMDDVKHLYENTPAEKAAELGAEAIATGSASLFEIECDDARTRYMANSSTECFGPAPVVSYLFGLENELATIRVILGGIAAGLPREVIRERMRKTYV